MTLRNGQVLQGRYRIVKPLGQGGMGAVYRAWDTRLNVAVALKEMVPQPGLDSQTLTDLRHQFQQEAQILARLNHPHLVRVTDFFEEGGNAYLVMDFVEGQSLAERIEQENVLPEEKVLTWGEQLLNALGYCHNQGIIHRDVKPQNVIIRSDGQAVLVDFGLVKLWDPDDPRTKTAMRGMGTPEYAPPEQYDTHIEHTDARSDVYALGATLYHALTGEAPPTATQRISQPGALQPPRDLKPTISSTTEDAILRATELAIGYRFATAQDMAAALRGEEVTPPTRIAPQRDKTSMMERAVSAAPAQREAKFAIPVWAWALGGLVAMALIAGIGLAVVGLEWLPIPAVELPGITVAETDTPSPTFTPTPAETATATSTGTPTQTPSPTRTPNPTSTPKGDSVGATTPTPTATTSATPSATPRVTPTPGTPTSTPQNNSSTPTSNALITFEQWGSWRQGDQPYGDLTQSREKVHQDSYAAKLSYDFPATNEDYVVFLRSISLRGQPNTVGAWVYGDGSGHHLNVWIQDAQNEVWAVHLGEVGGSGWRQMAGVLDPNLSWPSGHISGPENGRIDYPVRFYALVLDRPDSGPRSGQIYIDDISVWQAQVDATVTPQATSTPITGGATQTPSSPSPTQPPAPAGEFGRIFYTIEAGENSYYLATTDPSWSQGTIIDPVSYGNSTCAGGATATTLAGQSVNLFYGYRCSIGSPKECFSPNEAYNVFLWKEGSDYSMSLRQTSDDAVLYALYKGPLNKSEPIMWAPDNSRFYFTIKHQLHQASPHSAGYQPVLPIAYETYLSPDGSMLLYLRPVGSVGAYDIWVANADGSNPRNVTNAPTSHKICARWGR